MAFHMENDQKTLWGLLLSWGGALGAITAGQVHIWIGIASGVLSLVATGYAIRMTKATIKEREIEMIRHAVALCHECQKGSEPHKCPLSAELRPPNCPVRKLEEKAKAHE